MLHVLPVNTLKSHCISSSGSTPPPNLPRNSASPALNVTTLQEEELSFNSSAKGTGKIFHT